MINAGLWIIGSTILGSNLALVQTLTDERAFSAAVQRAADRLGQLRDRYRGLASLAGELTAALGEPVEPGA